MADGREECSGMPCRILPHKGMNADNRPPAGAIVLWQPAFPRDTVIRVPFSLVRLGGAAMEMESPRHPQAWKLSMTQNNPRPSTFECPGLCAIYILAEFCVCVCVCACFVGSCRLIR